MVEPSVLMLKLDAVAPPGRLLDWFEEAGASVALVDLTAAATVPDPAEYAGLVVLGGTMSSTDDALFPFLPAVRACLRTAVERQVPTLAVCLGAQLLAAAHGGRVVTNPDGPELGAQLVAKRTAAAGDPVFGELPITPDVIQWHYDMVRDLPAGAIQLASSPACDNQAFRLGRLAWGIQFHIETTPEIVRRWAADDLDRLAGYDVDTILRRADAVHAELPEVWAPFIAAFVRVVADPDAVAEVKAVASSVAAPLSDPAAIRAALAAEAQAARGLLPMPTMRPPEHG